MKSANELYGDVEYETLSSSSEVEPPRPHRNPSAILWLGAGCLGTIIVGTLVFLVAQTTFKPSATISASEIEAEDWNHCGRSSAEAISRGCVMEPMYYGWMPSNCAWRDLSDKFPIFEDRKYYRFENLTDEVRPEELWVGQVNMIYTRRLHDAHCLYQWRKLQYALDNRKEFVDNRTISVWHSNHCADALSTQCETGAPWEVTSLQLGFYRCRKTPW